MIEECSRLGCNCVVWREPDISKEHGHNCENLKFNMQSDSFSVTIFGSFKRREYVPRV
jgi:hypothetical protein